MLELMIIRVLIALYSNTACEIGISSDYYSWVNDHPYYHVAKSFEIATKGDAWIMSDDGEYYLFVFKTDIDETLDTGTPDVHGKCFRRIG